MRQITTRQFYRGGKLFTATLIQDPNIDDVLIGEAEVQAHSIKTGISDPSRRVGRDVRNIILLFGVQR